MDIIDDFIKKEARIVLGGILNAAANKIEQLRETLQFYAEWGIDAPAVDAIIEEDRGDKAREALKEKE